MQTPISLKNIAYIGIISVVLITAVMIFWPVDENIRFSRAVLSGMIRGDVSVEQKIDWDNLIMADLNVGSFYRLFPNEKEKADYRKAFIGNFSVAFKKMGVGMSMYTDWKVRKAKADTAIVSAFDKKHKVTVLFALKNQLAGKRLVEMVDEKAVKK